MRPSRQQIVKRLRMVGIVQRLDGLRFNHQPTREQQIHEVGFLEILGLRLFEHGRIMGAE